MSSALPFDALTLSIDGTNLIEASAGTGKTYGIAALFTRLIVLEKKRHRENSGRYLYQSGDSRTENPFACAFGRSVAGFKRNPSFGRQAGTYFRRPEQIL